MYSDEEILRDLKRVCRLYGVGDSIYRRYGNCGITMVYRRFGSFNNAVEMVGLAFNGCVSCFNYKLGV